MQGEREQASANRSLGRFDLSDIPPAPRGAPQIEVRFDIDANGILNVSATDKATAKAQSIVIRASSGLSDEDVERMVADARQYAEEDRKFQELAKARNDADTLLHTTKKSLADLAAHEVLDTSAVTTAMKTLETAAAGNDGAQIRRATEALRVEADKLAENVYARETETTQSRSCLLYTSPSPRDATLSRMPSSA